MIIVVKSESNWAGDAHFEEPFYVFEFDEHLTGIVGDVKLQGINASQFGLSISSILPDNLNGE